MGCVFVYRNCELIAQGESCIAGVSCGLGIAEGSSPGDCCCCVWEARISGVLEHMIDEKLNAVGLSCSSESCCKSELLQEFLSLPASCKCESDSSPSLKRLRLLVDE